MLQVCLMRLSLNKDMMLDSHTPSTDASQQCVTNAESNSAVVESSELFHGQREVCILHDGERYRLRITRRGKLILQK